METRIFQIGEIREDTRTALATLSTEYPVGRHDGDEVLSHSPDAVDLSRAPLPLIVGHDGARLPVGLVENIRIEGKSLKGVLRFSKNADEIWNDVRDGILRNLSIGYRIIKRVKTQTGYLATRWEVFECSLVSAGADPMAGIGRNLKRHDVVPLGGSKMDKNDLLKERKIATDEMVQIAGGADLSSEDKEKFDRLKDGVESCDRRLEVLEDMEKVKKPEFRVPETKEKRDISFPGGPAADASYRSMFGEPARDDEGVEQFRTQLSGVPSGGGFSIPDILSSAWLDSALPDEVIRSRATIFPMQNQTLTIPGWDWSDMSAGECFGGFTMEWVAEAGTATAQTGKVRAISMSARKGTIHCDISSELAEDGLNFVGNLEAALKKSIAYGLDAAFFNGATGPLGITNDVALVSVSPEVGQTSEVDFMNVSKMYARMYAGGRKNCVWLCNDVMLPFLLTGLSVAIGTSGTWVNIFDSKNGEFRLLGKPVIFTPHLPVAKAANSLMLCDLSQFAIGMRKELRLERSNVPQWREDLLSYRLYVRADSQGTWNAAYSPAAGDDQSWCVGLAAI